MQLDSILNWATEILSRYHIPTSRLDAEVLMAHLLGLDRVQLYIQPDRNISETESTQFKKWIERRSAGEPVSYIRGCKEFWSLPFKVGPGVMIPRPDTEVLIEAILSKIPPHPPFSKGGVWEKRSIKAPPLKKGGRGDLPFHILDIGTGSGNMAIALAKEFPQAKITAIDVSEKALVYAKENAGINDVVDKIVFLQTDLTQYTIRDTPYDLIVSNPPYISSSVIETLDPGIRNFEPHMALDGGADGLDFYRRMGDTLPSLLKPGGLIAVEIGEDQAGQVVEIFEQAGLAQTEIIKDYSGLPRVILARANF